MHNINSYHIFLLYILTVYLIYNIINLWEGIYYEIILLKILSFIIVCTVLLFSIGQTAIAEEISSNHPVRWSIKSSTGEYYQTKISVDQLPANHVMRSYILTAVSNWNATPTKILCSKTAFNSSNVDLSIGTSDFFSKLGNPYAYTILTDTNGLVLIVPPPILLKQMERLSMLYSIYSYIPSFVLEDSDYA